MLPKQIKLLVELKFRFSNKARKICLCLVNFKIKWKLNFCGMYSQKISTLLNLQDLMIMCKRLLNLRKFSHPPKNVSNYYPEHYPTKETMLRIVIWHIFWRIEPKWPDTASLVKSADNTKFITNLTIQVVLHNFI